MSQAVAAVKAPRTPQEQRDLQRSINWRATAAASLIASTAASLAIHEPIFPANSLPRKIGNFLTVDVPGLRTIIENNDVSGTNTEITTHEAHHSYTQRYARHFATNPQAGRFIGNHQAKVIAKEIADVAKPGTKIYSLRLTGEASAEDNHRDGGLSTRSLKNLDLAAHRGKEAETKLKPLLRQQADDDKNVKEALEFTAINQGQAIEQHLSREKIRMIGRMARKAGFHGKYASADFIQAWNRNSRKITHHDDIVLRDTLAKARRVLIDIRWLQYKNTNKKSASSTSHRDDLPLPLPLLIPIPLRRRKKKIAQVIPPARTAKTVNLPRPQHTAGARAASPPQATWYEKLREEALANRLKLAALGGTALSAFYLHRRHAHRGR